MDVSEDVLSHTRLIKKLHIINLSVAACEKRHQVVSSLRTGSWMTEITNIKVDVFIEQVCNDSKN